MLFTAEPSLESLVGRFHPRQVILPAIGLHLERLSLPKLAGPHTGDSVLVTVNLGAACRSVLWEAPRPLPLDNGRGAGHHSISLYYMVPQWEGPHPAPGSRVGRRLRLPVVFLDGDGTALLLPGAAVRTEVFRFRLADWSMISSLMEEQDCTQNEDEKHAGEGHKDVGTA